MKGTFRFARRFCPVVAGALLIFGCSSKSGGADEGNDDAGDDGADTTTGLIPGTGPDPTATGGSMTSPGTSMTTMGFIDEPDGGVAGQCDPKSQDCPDGEKCTAFSNMEGSPWNANKCVPVTGDGQEGDPCDIVGGKYTGEDNCDVGLLCLQTDDDGNGGACVQFCDAMDQCPGAGMCATYNDGSLPICLNVCDPLNPTCPPDQGCYPSQTTGEFVCFKYSGMNGEGAHGEECNFLNQCLPGHACIGAAAVDMCPANASGCCSVFCDLTDPTPDANCIGAEVCEQFYMDPLPSVANVGVCAIPA